MNSLIEQTVFVIQTATHDLIELAATACSKSNPLQLEEIEAEIHSTMLSLMSAVILSHSKFSAGEQAFLKIILDRPNTGMTNERVLNEYGSRWSALATQVPNFLKVAVAADRGNGTNSAHAMLVPIQLIGNNVAITDGHFAPQEHILVQNYIAHLEAYIDQAMVS